MSYLAYQTANTWNHCYVIMSATFRARELLQSYADLENLYYKQIGLWFLWWTCPQVRKATRILRLRIIEKRVEIRELGGKVPSFWSL